MATVAGAIPFGVAAEIAKVTRWKPFCACTCCGVCSTPPTLMTTRLAEAPSPKPTTVSTKVSPGRAGRLASILEPSCAAAAIICGGGGSTIKRMGRLESLPTVTRNGSGPAARPRGTRKVSVLPLNTAPAMGRSFKKTFSCPETAGPFNCTVAMAPGAALATERLNWRGLAGKMANCTAGSCCNPEINVTLLIPGAAFAATRILTSSLLGAVTQTRRTTMSLEPKPSATCPSTKLVLRPVISTIASVPAGKPPGLMEKLLSVPSRVKERGLLPVRKSELCPSGLSATNAARWPLGAAGATTVRR